MNSSSFFLVALFNSVREKKYSFRIDAVIYLDITSEVPSALGLSFGVLSYAGIMAALQLSGTKILATLPKYSYICTWVEIQDFCFISLNASAYAYWL